MSHASEKHHRAKRIQAEYRSKSNRSRNAEWRMSQQKRKYTADHSEWNHCHHDQRIPEGKKQDVEQAQDHNQTDRHNNGEPMQFFLQTVEFSRPSVLISGG